MEKSEIPQSSIDVVVAAIDQWLGRKSIGYDYVKIGKLMAAVDTAKFIEEHLPTAPIYSSRGLLHQAALRERRTPGMVLEFGVASGKSIDFIAKNLPQETIYGFDSFEGLPEDWISSYRKGHFAQKVPQVADNVELVVGLFDETLPGFLARHPDDVSYLHIDCDLYSSTRSILQLLGGRIRAGTVIVFDEYFNYPSWRQHEHKAFMEFVEERDVKFHFLGAVHSSVQASILIDSIG
ncbi:MAG: class I SAM-dependent methyltransferase [Pseudomonadota bacterium]|nr:class I SAM-dependent methyltransferase [Pseudomonadota bacterium]